MTLKEIDHNLENNYLFDEPFFKKVMRKLVTTKNFDLATRVYDSMNKHNIPTNDVVMGYLIEAAVSENPITAFNYMLQVFEEMIKKKGKYFQTILKSCI